MKRNLILSLFKEITDWGLENLGRYYSKYRAFVADRDDPENLGRLRLIIPEVGGNDVIEQWALPSSMYSGQGYGNQVIPQKGDLVWVEFERGHPNKPIWSHGYRGRGEMPTNEEFKDNDNYWFRTPRGHEVHLNDTKNKIIIKSRLGDKIELNENGISIVSSKHISLGELNKSKYKAVLGEELETVLKDFHKVAQGLNTAITKDIAISSGTLRYVNLAIEMPEALITLQKIEVEIPKILSKLNTLE